MSFKIIVDSCCDLTPAELREDCFIKVPLTIRVGMRPLWMPNPSIRKPCCK